MSAKRRGLDYERAIVNKARSKPGVLAWRTAGSHGLIDVTIIDTNTKMITLVQAKVGKSYTNGDKKRILDKIKFLEGEYTIQVKVLGGYHELD